MVGVMTRLLGTQGDYLLGVWHRQDQDAGARVVVVNSDSDRPTTITEAALDHMAELCGKDRSNPAFEAWVQRQLDRVELGERRRLGLA